MRIEITVPVRVADVAARDLMSRGGSVTDKKETSASTTISGLAPLKSMSDYGSALRSISGGQGAFRMAFDYDEAEPLGS